MEMKSRIQDKFKVLYGADGEMFASAGRINLIGEHTDYNGGYVFPGAIDKGIIAEIKLNGTDKVHAYSLDYDEYVEFGLNEEDKPQQSWARYIFGVCREMQKRGGKVEGFDKGSLSVLTARHWNTNISHLILFRPDTSLSSWILA